MSRAPWTNQARKVWRRVSTSPAAIGTGLDDAWVWFRVNVHGARVAYTGTNLGFPLAGRELANRVTYVNGAGAPGDRLHDFGRRLPPPGGPR